MPRSNTPYHSPLKQQAVTRRVTIAYPRENAFFREAKGDDVLIWKVNSHPIGVLSIKSASYVLENDANVRLGLDAFALHGD